MKDTTEEQVQFREKATWQKADCINRSADYQCPNTSVLEAVYKNARIRCCTDERCKKRAADLAKASGDALDFNS